MILLQFVRAYATVVYAKVFMKIVAATAVK